jgi:hypothetical protein
METTIDRVNFAVRVILRGGNTTRNFDGCFENDDSTQVAAGVYRRALKNPRLMQALPRYLDLESCRDSYNKVMLRQTAQTQTQTQTPTTDQTAPNLVWVFAESEAVPSCQKTGRLLDFMAPTVEEAAKNLEYYLSLSDARACLGKSGLVAYPHGIDGAHAWVFDAQTTARTQGDRIPGEEVNL